MAVHISIQSTAMANKTVSLFICCFIYSILNCENVCGAMTDEEAKAEFSKVILACASKLNVNMLDLMSMTAMQVPTDYNVKCVLACAYRKVGTMNDKGLYDLEGAYKLSEATMKGDDERIKKGKEFADFCSNVNDEKVTDDEKGCDRAALIFKCTVKNAAKYGFTV